MHWVCEHHQLVWIPDWQGLEEGRVHYADDCRVGANRNRQNADRDSGGAPVLS